MTGLILLLLIFRGNSSHTSNNVTYSVPTGTYCTNSPDWPSNNTVYLVLAKDNTYTLYRQFEVISRGTYENDTLSQTVSFDGDGGFTGSYGDNYSEINLSAKDDSYSLKKYYDTCFYINVPNSQ